MAGGAWPTGSGRSTAKAGRTTRCEPLAHARARLTPAVLVPKFLMWLIAPKAGFSRKFVSKNVGHSFKADNSYSKKDLGIEYRSIEETMTDHFQQILDDGLIDKN